MQRKAGLEKELAHTAGETGKSTVFRVCQQAEDSGRVNAVVQIQRPSRLHSREDGSEFSPDLGLTEQGTVFGSTRYVLNSSPPI